jgi:hypothetical protein
VVPAPAERSAGGPRVAPVRPGRRRAVRIPRGRRAAVAPVPDQHDLGAERRRGGRDGDQRVVRKRIDLEHEQVGQARVGIAEPDLTAGHVRVHRAAQIDVTDPHVIGREDPAIAQVDRCEGALPAHAVPTRVGAGRGGVPAAVDRVDQDGAGHPDREGQQAGQHERATQSQDPHASIVARTRPGVPERTARPDRGRRGALSRSLGHPGPARTRIARRRAESSTRAAAG